MAEEIKTDQLTDREVIEICAEICGIEIREGDVVYDNGVIQYYRQGEHGTMSYIFNPLHDCNDAWRVISDAMNRGLLISSFRLNLYDIVAIGLASVVRQIAEAYKATQTTA